jgi:hypothetical protein
MPVIAVNIEPTLYEAVEHALAWGNYSDLHQFFVVAVRNQLALEASVALEERVAPTGTSTAPSATTEPPKHAPSASTTLDLPGLVKTMLAPAAEELPEPARVENDSAVLWGQINRILPIAVGVRVLAHLSADKTNGVPVEEWHETATDVAVALRSHLRQLDEAAGRRHGSLWSTAFPDDTPASAHRYVNQFLGLPKAGLSDGGAAFLGFAAFDQDDTVVRLTTAGAEWAAFANPLLDDGDSPTRTFSVEETAFFINHLKKYRPAELRFLTRVAALVEQGRSRTQLDEALAAEHPQWKKYIATMRAGALGRLSDLGFLERTRRGLTVDYALTPLAAEVGLLRDGEVGPLRDGEEGAAA